MPCGLIRRSPQSRDEAGPAMCRTGPCRSVMLPATVAVSVAGLAGVAPGFLACVYNLAGLVVPNSVAFVAAHAAFPEAV